MILLRYNFSSSENSLLSIDYNFLVSDHSPLLATIATIDLNLKQSNK